MTIDSLNFPLESMVSTTQLPNEVDAKTQLTWQKALKNLLIIGATALLFTPGPGPAIGVGLLIGSRVVSKWRTSEESDPLTLGDIGLSKTLLAIKNISLFLLSSGAAKILASCGIGIDYSDPEALEKAREEALQKPLPEVIKKHGWENLVRYSILSPTAFDTSYRAHAKTLSFKDLLLFYIQILEALSAFKTALTAPSPTEWKETFKAETSQMRCDEILKNYPLETLQKYELISPLQKTVLEHTLLTEELFSKWERKLDAQFYYDTRQARYDLEESKKSAKRAYDQHPAHFELRQVQSQKASNLAWPSSPLANQCKWALPPFPSGILRIREMELQSTLEKARNERDQKTLMAETQFACITHPEREKLVAAHGMNLAKYEESIALFSSIYHGH